MTPWENPMEDEMAKRAELVAAAKDLNVVLCCDPPIDVTKSVETIKEQLMSAGKLLNDDDKIEAVTRAVLDELLGTPVGDGDGEVVTETLLAAGIEIEGSVEEAGEVQAEPKVTAASGGRPGRKPAVEKPAKVKKVIGATKTQIGEFKPVRRGSRLHKYVEMAGSGTTLAALAKVGDKYTEKDVIWSFRYSLRRDHGIDFAISDTGKVSLVLPQGKSLVDCVTATLSGNE